MDLRTVLDFDLFAMNQRVIKICDSEEELYYGEGKNVPEELKNRMIYQIDSRNGYIWLEDEDN